MRAFLSLMILMAGFATLCGVPAAQGQSGNFAPVVTVNGTPISGYELDQRILFLRLLRAPGDIEKQAREALIEDRLRKDAAKRIGVTLSADDVKNGMEEFAARANLTTEKFVEAIGQGGVEPETFRDFVTSGLIWREVVRAKYAGRVNISEAEIDRALSVSVQRGAGPRVLMSELIVPAIAGDMQGALRKANKVVESLKGHMDFATAARQNSAAPSRGAGGKLGWIPLTNLPASIRPVIAQLRPGQISEPLAVPGGVALFQLHAMDKGSEKIAAGAEAVDYAQYRIAGGAAEVASVRQAVATCDDLYVLARKTGKDRLTRVTQTAGQVPADIARELATLDPNEASTALSRGGQPLFLMLCGRSATGQQGGSAAPADQSTAADGTIPAVRDTLGFGAGPSREAVKLELQNQRLNGLSDTYLAQLKADAVIVEP